MRHVSKITAIFSVIQALLSELADHTGKVEDLKNTLKQLMRDHPDSPEVETWKQQLKDIGQ